MWFVCYIGLEFVNSAAEYVLAATKDIDLFSAILVERRSNGKPETCDDESFPKKKVQWLTDVRMERAWGKAG